jgi:hypothetical protein
MNAFGVRDSRKSCADSSMSVPFQRFLVWAADINPTQSTASVFSAEEETVKTVSHFLSSFVTGLKPGVNEMSQFLTWGQSRGEEDKPGEPDVKLRFNMYDKDLADPCLLSPLSCLFSDQTCNSAILFG